MKRLASIVLLGVAACAFLAGCKKVPGYVIQPEKMAEIMADMYVGKAVVEMNHGRYPDDSSRQVLKQSILARHNVDRARFDTSLVWYGHHAEVYGEVYDKTIAILERREAEAGTAAVRSAMVIEGDSVEVWTDSPYVAITDKMPTRMVEFDLAADTACRRGDSYTWRFKLVDNDHAQVRWNMYAEYTDSTGEWLTATVTSSDLDGRWNQMVFATDSTRTLRRLRGSFDVDIDGGVRTLWIDSISLVRKRASQRTYQQRYRLRSHRIY